MNIDAAAAACPLRGFDSTVTAHQVWPSRLPGGPWTWEAASLECLSDGRWLCNTCCAEFGHLS